MKSAFLLQLLALPAILAIKFEDDAKLLIMARAELGTVTVEGKRFSDGHDEDYLDGGLKLCMRDDGIWTSQNCGSKTIFYQIARLRFSESTTDPRPFTITTPEFSQDCTVTVTADGYLSWDVEQIVMEKPGSDGIKVDCEARVDIPAS